MNSRQQTWHENRRQTPEKLALAREILEQIRLGVDTNTALRRHPLSDGGHVGKHLLVAAYHQLVGSGVWVPDLSLLEKIRMKPVRTLSGVTTVTALTKPYPCPAQCIFCPSDVRLPKSYLADEPGASRGLENNFDPYRQVVSRLEALTAVGHPTDKVELLVLGGTWSAYRRDYQEWFIKRCFEALNGVNSDTLDEAQRINETAEHRNVGLVLETRPDFVTPRELARMRRYGVTKVQLGVQSLDDDLLMLNKRGHTVAKTRRAFDLLRAGGFKIVAHWMPNLLGATLESDRRDFARLWEGLCPDELKIYPTQLLEGTELYDVWLRGEYKPYTTDELIDLIADIKTTIPRYCRVNRVVRDIPSTHVVEGNKRTSLRQDVHAEMERRGEKCQCIRCREVRNRKVNSNDLHFDDLVYQTGSATEHFLSFGTPEDRLAGFLRLSLPTEEQRTVELADLENAAIIREVHVYGQSVPVGTEEEGAAQHIGLGGELIERAENIAAQAGYPRLAVISAIGTRRYYQKHGFEHGTLYMVKRLNGKQSPPEDQD